MNDITQRPAHLGESDSGGFAETLGFARPPRIITNDGFSVISEDGVAVLPRSIDLSVIMLWENDTRLYYPKGDYDPANPTPPACYSDNRVTPSEGAMQPQSDLCASCAHSVWDQPTPKGNLVPACDSRYKVACLVAGAGGKVFLLSVAPASRKPYELYRKYLKGHNAKPHEVVTKLTYVDKQLGFQFGSWVEAKAVDFVKKIRATNEPAELVGASDKPKQIALPAPTTLPEAKAIVEQAVIETLTKAPPATFGEPEVEDRPTKPATRPRGRPPKEVTVGPSSEPSVPQGHPQGSTAFGAAPAAPVAKPMAPPPPVSNGGFGQQHYPNPPVGAQGSQGFGMEAAQTPNADIQARLDEAFGPR